MGRISFGDRKLCAFARIISRMTNNIQTSKQIVEGFWAAMQTNDFAASPKYMR